MEHASMKRTPVGNPSFIDQAKTRIEAIMQHASDRDELLRMLRTTEDRIWKLKRRMPTSVKRRRKKKLSMASSNYVKSIKEHEALGELLRNTISAHEEVLLTSRGIKTQKTLSHALQLFANCITQLCSKWHIIERWYRGARNILAEIKSNTENLQRFKFTPA